MNEQPTMFTFVLRLTDRPGAMEVIAATFAQRGVSICTSLGTDSTLDADGHAKILLSFSTTPAKKEALRRALTRLARVQSVVEYPQHSLLPQKTALARFTADTAVPVLPESVEGIVRLVATDADSGEVTYLIAAPVLAVDDLLQQAKTNGTLRDVTQCVLAL